MANKPTSTGKVAIEYLKRYPKLPILTIAKKMYADNDMLFNSVDHARSLLKNHAGLGGKETRKHVKPELQRPVTHNYTPFANIPESYKSSPSFITLPIHHNNILVLADVHIPYHDENALRAAIQYGLSKNVNCIYLNGDILDFYGLSSFDKDPSKPKMKVELEQGRWFIKELRTAFPNAGIYYKIGNHEHRLERWLTIKAPEWIETDEFQLQMLLRFGESGVKLVESQTIAIAGDLFIIHGHEYRGGGTVQPARALYLKTKRNTICGHFHRKSEFVTRDIHDVIHGAYTTGCLCELNPDYMPHNDWVHGFCVVQFDATGKFTVDNKMIIDGKIV